MNHFYSLMLSQMLFCCLGEHLHRRLHRQKGPSDQNLAPRVHAVCLQQWPEAEGVGLL